MVTSKKEVEIQEDREDNTPESITTDLLYTSIRESILTTTNGPNLKEGRKPELSY